VSQEDVCKSLVELYPTFTDAYSKIGIPGQGFSTLKFGDWSEELYKGNVTEFQCNCCFSAWRNGVGKWRSWRGI